jgi:hypothetical protein
MKVMMDSPHLQPAFPESIEQTVAQMPATPKRSKALRQLVGNSDNSRRQSDAPVSLAVRPLPQKKGRS